MTKAIMYGNQKLDFFVEKYESEEFNPDEIDRRIIRYLSVDGRASYTEIAESIGVTPATVRNRLTRLVASGIIKNFKPVVDKKLYNLDISAFFMITLESSKQTEGVFGQLQDHSEISQISVLASNPHIVCTVFARNMEEFSVLLAKITQIDGIKEINTNFIIKSVVSGCVMQ